MDRATLKTWIKYTVIRRMSDAEIYDVAATEPIGSIIQVLCEEEGRRRGIKMM